MSQQQQQSNNVKPQKIGGMKMSGRKKPMMSQREMMAKHLDWVSKHQKESGAGWGGEPTSRTPRKSVKKPSKQKKSPSLDSVKRSLKKTMGY